MKEILTPCILQTVIICCTIIIVGLIGVSAFRVKCNNQRSWGSYIFSASILLVFAISIFSYCFCGDRNVLDFISLASALISIILAVITIIYSYFINSRSSGQIDQLNKAAADVSNATSSYEESAETLQENIKKIINAIGRVEEKTDRLLNEGVTSKMNTNDSFSEFDLKKYTEGFIGASSKLGVMLLYACMRSKDRGSTFDLSLFGEDNAIYCYGYFIATVSTGLITGNIDFDSKKISMTSYVSELSEAIDSWLGDHKEDEFVEDTKKKIDNNLD